MPNVGTIVGCISLFIKIHVEILSLVIFQILDVPDIRLKCSFGSPEV